MKIKKKIGVLLSGCGFFDGSEIHEATLTLYYLDREDVETVCIAPNAGQYHVVDHHSSEASEEKRNMLKESARLARGKITPLDAADASQLDGLILPGGFGAVKNLADYAVSGRSCTVRDDVRKLILAVFQSGKPLGAMCIAPVVVAVALKDVGICPKLTIGTDESTASDIVSFGADHVNASVTDIVIDEENRIATTPAYMLGPGISDIAAGIEKLVKQIVYWA